MEIIHTPITDFGVEQAIGVLNDGFADYIVPFHMSAAAFEGMSRTASLDNQESRILIVDGKPAGIALIALRGNESRLAAMNLKPEFRGQGLGREFMFLLLADARKRGNRRMFLEVIASNSAAVRLYEAVGFTVIRCLNSYESEPSPELHYTSDSDAKVVTMGEVAQVVSTDGLNDLPWQVAGPTISQYDKPSEAYRLADTYAVISDPNAPQIYIQCLVTRKMSRNMGQATRLVRALFDRYPGKRWIVPAIFPEEMGGFFEHLGFDPGGISQLQMAIEIKPDLPCA